MKLSCSWLSRQARILLNHRLYNNWQQIDQAQTAVRVAQEASHEAASQLLHSQAQESMAVAALPGFSAATNISPARDRVIGVALGTLVLWFVFDQLWPTRTSDVFQRTLERIRSATITLRESGTERTNLSIDDLSSMRSEVSRELANMQMLEASAYFDFGRSRRRELAKSRQLSRRIETSAAEFYTEMHRWSTN